MSAQRPSWLLFGDFWLPKDLTKDLSGANMSLRWTRKVQNEPKTMWNLCITLEQARAKIISARGIPAMEPLVVCTTFGRAFWENQVLQ